MRNLHEIEIRPASENGVQWYGYVFRSDIKDVLRVLKFEAVERKGQPKMT